VKIKIQRPDRAAAVDVFNKYMTAELPSTRRDPTARRRVGDGGRMIAGAVAAMYSSRETAPRGHICQRRQEVLYFKDFASGAMIESVVRRAKKLASSDTSENEKGITSDDLLNAVLEEFKENEDRRTRQPGRRAKIAARRASASSRQVARRQIPSAAQRRELITTGRICSRWRRRRGSLPAPAPRRLSLSSTPMSLRRGTARPPAIRSIWLR